MRFFLINLLSNNYVKYVYATLATTIILQYGREIFVFFGKFVECVLNELKHAF